MVICKWKMTKKYLHCESTLLQIKICHSKRKKRNARRQWNKIHSNY